MAKGSRYWANSYIVLDNRKKIYLDEFESDIKERLKSKKKLLKFHVSGIFGGTITVKKSSIVYYGKV